MANNLYYIQDDNRPMWVVAEDWSSALAKWQEKIMEENEILLVDIDGPEGITKICDGDDLLLWFWFGGETRCLVF